MFDNVPRSETHLRGDVLESEAESRKERSVLRVFITLLACWLAFINTRIKLGTTLHLFFSSDHVSCRHGRMMSQVRLRKALWTTGGAGAHLVLVVGDGTGDVVAVQPRGTAGVVALDGSAIGRP